jgi:uncharacterized protein with HEPN domain
VREDRARLEDIARALDRIQAETAGGKNAFDNDPKVQIWVLYHLQIIGEACRGLSESFRARFPDPVWRNAIGLRNILVHHYFEIDADLIWEVVERDLPPLREVVESALKGISGAG